MDEITEGAFLDELEKIGVDLGSIGKTLSSWGKHSVLGSTLGTHAKRFAVGAVPGVVAGAAAGGPGHRLSGAVKGGVAGGATGVVGGALLQRRAQNLARGSKSLTEAHVGPQRPQVQQQVADISGQTLPGI